MIESFINYFHKRIGKISQRSYERRGVELLTEAKKENMRSYSQLEEDLVLHYLLFNKLGLGKISYLDIGSSHPINLSNTYLFYKKGINGVCVDADPDRKDLYKRLRPQDRFVNIGVSDGKDNQVLDFYIMKNAPELNTFVKEEAERLVKDHGFKIEDIIKIKVVNINSIIQQYCKKIPELLSIDIEGLDMKVLCSLEYSVHRPKVIIAEIQAYGKIDYVEVYKATKFMKKQGYQRICNIGLSTIFIDDRI